jgi:hypothetical protein
VFIRLLTWTLAALLLISSGAANAILIRKDYDDIYSSNYKRYLNLANQSRFDTVGGIEFFDSALSTGGSHIFSSGCTGTLISADIILTAAHCFDLGSSAVRSFTYDSSLSAMTLAPGKQVFFAGGPNLATDGNHSSASIRYAAQIDRLSIYPHYAFNGATAIGYGGDLALLRIYGAPWIGTLPTNYLPLNTSTTEPFPSPAIGITVGYGATGNGVNGETSLNPAAEKRAGLTIVQYDLLHPNTLTSVFRSPGTYSSLLLPSNFLQAAPGHGDSGGPLVLNVGGVDTVAGVVQGGGDTYGQKNWWTRVSSFSDWINSEASVLGAAPTLALPGSSVTSPLLPTVVRDIGTTVKEKVFSFFGGALGQPLFLDPGSSPVVNIYIDKGPALSSVFLPTGFGRAQLWLADASGKFVDSGLSLAEGQWFSFADPVHSFELKGLTDNGENLALGFQFSDAGSVDLRWDSITAVPESSEWLLLLCGLPFVVLNGWRRRALA